MNIRRNRWSLKRLGVVAAGVSVPVLAAVIFYRTMSPSRLLSPVVGWSIFSGVLVALIFAVQSYVEHLLAKTHENAVRGERERVARELHDTLIQGCASVSMMLEAIASTSVAQSELLHLAREQSRQTVMETREAIWNLRRTGDEVDLIAALHNVANEIRLPSGKPLQITHNVDHLSVPANSADEISMTVREALRNAVRHSGTERITVELRSRRRGLSICVQDFGCGIAANAPAQMPGHYGMLGMQERMRRLGGGVHVQEMPGGGTSVQLMLRWGSLRKAPVRS
jgi:signal transduction histidine kinase